MPALVLLHTAPARDQGRWATPGGSECLLLDPLAERLAAQRRLKPVLVDDLLDWETRAAIERGVGQMLETLRCGPAHAEHRLAGLSMIDAAEYELRREWTSLLCIHAAARALPASASEATVLAQPGTPSSIVLGAAAATGRVDPGAVIPWRSLVSPPPPRRWLGPAAHAVVAARATVSKPGAIRVLALPAQRVAMALAPLAHRQSRAIGLAVGTFPGLTHGDPARLVARKALPARAPRGRRADPPAPPPLGRVHDDPALDTALRLTADHVLRGIAPRVAAVASALAALERLRHLRALLLPGTALGSARLLCTWAHEHDMRIAVVQHGVYTARDWDGSDSAADIVYAWGAGVPAQVALWPRGSPEARVVGTPGVTQDDAKQDGPRPRHNQVLRRALIVSTTPSPGSALALWGFHWAFLSALKNGLRQLRDAGVEIALRVHPSESWQSYKRILDALGLSWLGPAAAERFARVAIGHDVVISAPSSAAIEAAVLGVPVLLWTSLIPPAVRERFWIQPFSSALPGMFENADDFERLTRTARAAPGSLLEDARALAASLARYGAPFEPSRMAAELVALSE